MNRYPDPTRPVITTPNNGIGPIIEVTGDDLKMLLGQLAAAVMTDRIQRLRVQTHNESGRVVFQVNHGLWSPTMGKAVPQ